MSQFYHAFFHSIRKKFIREGKLKSLTRKNKIDILQIGDYLVPTWWTIAEIGKEALRQNRISIN